MADDLKWTFPTQEELAQDCLRKKLTIEEAVKLYPDHGIDKYVAPLLREGDELWHFRSPDSTWQSLCGREGLAIVRDGKVIKTMVTLMN